LSISKPAAPLRVGLVAGEASGDTLGAGLIEALRRIDPQTEFFGVAGPKMRAAGCDAWEPAESLAVMGLFEIVRELPRLASLLARLRRSLIAARPDVFVGIDAPDTNLRIAPELHAAGIPTRVHRMQRSVDLVLCLLPFEKRFYDDHGVPAVFVGHPLADTIPLAVDRNAARAALAIAPAAEVVALLPGSRRGEVARLARDFAATAAWLAERRPALEFIAPMASEATREIFAGALERWAPKVKVTLLEGGAQSALIASNVVLVASGTATLEAALCKRPMVVVYRLGALTAWLIKRLNLVKSRFFAQPNLLADRRVVGEYFQEQLDPQALGTELLMWLDDAQRRAQLEEEFVRLHQGLKRDASARAAQAIMDLVRRARAPREAAS